MTRESIMLSSGGSITARATVGPQYPHRSNFHVAAETSERECSSTSGTNYGFVPPCFCSLSAGRTGWDHVEERPCRVASAKIFDYGVPIAVQPAVLTYR